MELVYSHRLHTQKPTKHLWRFVIVSKHCNNLPMHPSILYVRLRFYINLYLYCYCTVYSHKCIIVFYMSVIEHLNIVYLVGGNSAIVRFPSHSSDNESRYVNFNSPTE